MNKPIDKDDETKQGVPTDAEGEERQSNPIPFLLELCDFGGPYDEGQEYNH